jgi:hypothetical protein
LGWVVARRPFTGALIWLVRLFGFCMLVALWADSGRSGSSFVVAALAWGLTTSLSSTLLLSRVSGTQPTVARRATPVAHEAARRVWTAAALELIPVAAAGAGVGLSIFIDRDLASASVVVLALTTMAFILFLICALLYFVSGAGWMMLDRVRIGLAVGAGRGLLLVVLLLAFMMLSFHECIDCGGGPTNAQLYTALAVTTALPVLSAAALLLTQPGRSGGKAVDGSRGTGFVS